MTECVDEQRTYRKHMVLPVEEVEGGDQLRDRGRWRLVDHVEPRLLEQAIYIYFTDDIGPDDPLGVRVPMTISLWRVCGES